MHRIEAPETGAFLGRRLKHDGDHHIAVAVTLPTSIWDTLTEFVGDIYCGDRDEAALPLLTRIALFLDMESQVWMAQCRTVPDASDDLDDEVPF